MRARDAGPSTKHRAGTPVGTLRTRRVPLKPPATGCCGWWIPPLGAAQVAGSSGSAYAPVPESVDGPALEVGGPPGPSGFEARRGHPHSLQQRFLGCKPHRDSEAYRAARRQDQIGRNFVIRVTARSGIRIIPLACCRLQSISPRFGAIAMARFVLATR